MSWHFGITRRIDTTTRDYRTQVDLSRPVADFIQRRSHAACGATTLEPGLLAHHFRFNVSGVDAPRGRRG